MVNREVDMKFAVRQMLEGRRGVQSILGKQHMVKYDGAGTEIGFSLIVFLQRSFQTVRTRTKLYSSREAREPMRRFDEEFPILYRLRGTE